MANGCDDRTSERGEPCFLAGRVMRPPHISATSFANPDKNFLMIMKDGTIYKDKIST